MKRNYFYLIKIELRSDEAEKFTTSTHLLYTLNNMYKSLKLLVDKEKLLHQNAYEKKNYSLSEYQIVKRNGCQRKLKS